jgi:hypothetical protein
VKALKDEDGIVLTSLDTLTLSVWDLKSGAIINGRDRQDVLNQNDVTFNGDGSLLWRVQAADRPILDDTQDWEDHVAMFEFTYAGGGRTGHWVLQDRIDNLQKVPATP